MNVRYTFDAINTLLSCAFRFMSSVQIVRTTNYVEHKTHQTKANQQKRLRRKKKTNRIIHGMEKKIGSVDYGHTSIAAHSDVRTVCGFLHNGVAKAAAVCHNVTSSYESSTHTHTHTDSLCRVRNNNNTIK